MSEPIPQKPMLPPYDSAELRIQGGALKWIVAALKCGNCKHTWIGMAAVPLQMGVPGVAWKCLSCGLLCGVPTRLPRARLVMHNIGLNIQLLNKGDQLPDEVRDPKRVKGVLPAWGTLPGDPGFKKDEDKEKGGG